MRVTNTKEARDNIGSWLYWDDVSERWRILRGGEVEDVFNGQVCIRGDWKEMRDLAGLRDAPNEGAFSDCTEEEALKALI